MGHSSSMCRTIIVLYCDSVIVAFKCYYRHYSHNRYDIIHSSSNISRSNGSSRTSNSRSGRTVVVIIEVVVVVL